MAYKPAESVTHTKSLEHLAAVFYRKKAEEGGYLRDFQIARYKDESSMESVVEVSGVAVATGKRLNSKLWLRGMETAIDQDIIKMIQSMVSEAKLLGVAFEPEPPL